MAPPTIGVTGSGQQRPAPELPTPTKAIADRYTGYAAYYQSRPPMLTSDGSLMAAARRREAEARAAAERARLAQQRADLAQQRLPSILEVAAGPFAQGPKVPYAPGQSPQEIEAAKAKALNTPMSVPIDTEGLRPGPDKPGYRQEKVFAGSRLVGYRYVPSGNPGDNWGPGASWDQPQPGRVAADWKGISDVAERRYTRDQLVEQDRYGIEGTADLRDVGPYVHQVAREAYGEPEQKTDAWGNTYYEYPTDRKYIGIPDEYAAMGWMPVQMPKAPGENASFDEQMAYRKAVRAGIVAPRYREGDNLSYVRNMSPDQVFKVQRQLKAAGLLDPDLPIFRGKMNAEQYQLISELMGEANVTGQTLEAVIAGHIQTHQANLRASRGGGGGGGGGGDITRQVQIQYNTTSLATGRAMLARVLEDALGRAPSDTELSQYMAILNAAEKKSPTKTVTNYVREGNTMTSTSRTKPSTVDPEAMAREFATQINGGEEFFDMQANSYLDRLMQMLIGAQNGG